MGESDIKTPRENSAQAVLGAALNSKLLQAQQNVLETVFESMAEGVVVADLNGNLLIVNSAARRIVGMDPVEAYPEDWPQVYGAFHPDMVTPWGKDDLVLLKAIRGESMDNVEVFFRNPNIPEGKFVNVTGRPLVDANGSRSGGIIIMSDISERKRAEAERKALIADLDRRNSELERYAYTISHDLKTPLVTIKGFLGLLRKDLSRGNWQYVNKNMEQIGKAADTMNELLEDLLELSRLGQAVNANESVALKQLARDAVDILAGHLQDNNVAISIDSRMPVVIGDSSQLLEVLLNLIENAIKFMGEQTKPRVEIGVHYDRGQAIYFVSDNGIGIHPDYHARIFNLFERLDQNVEGTGVGLALVDRIIKMHGGTIWVHSEGKGTGSCFYFTLPQQDG